MEIIEQIIRMFIAHFYLISFISGFFGEEAILFLTFLASENTLHLQIILILAPLGLLFMDTLYFYLGRFKLSKKVSEELHTIGKAKGVLPWIIRFSGRHSLLALIITKFIYGTRIPLMVYYNTRGMKYKRFLIYDFVALELWAVIMIPLAWLAGRGLTLGLHLIKDFSKIAGTAILFIIAWYIANKIIAYVFTKRMKRTNLR